MNATRTADAITRRLSTLGSAVVAFSGGVDSTLVLKLAHDALGARALGVTGVSPSLAPAEAEDARRLARAIGARLRFVPTDQLDDERYVRNDERRCYFCKTHLYEACRQVLAETGFSSVLNGTNADDVGDWRPGLVAADEGGVIAPLLEAGLDKAAVRALARHLGLPNWDKPAMPCLASRLPYGTAVTDARMTAVDRVESWLRARGYRDVRARHHGDLVRIEVERARIAELREEKGLADVARAAGFKSFALADDGFKSGRLNEGIVPRASAPEDSR